MKKSEKVWISALVGGLLLLYLRESYLRSTMTVAAPSCPVCPPPSNARAIGSFADRVIPVPAQVNTEGDSKVEEPGDEDHSTHKKGASGSRVATSPDECSDGYQLSPLLSQFIDIDFIQFVLMSQPSPAKAPIVDIGIYQAGELIHMARTGHTIEAFEPNPHRYNACMVEIRREKEDVQKRINLHNLAVSDSTEPLHFQLAGLDSHAYILKPGEEAKEKSIVVNTIPIAKIVSSDQYFVKIDTQGFDTRILEQLMNTIETDKRQITFIQFEFSPHFEVTRSKRTKEDHKRIFRRLIDLGYDIYQGAAVQPWKKSHRSQYGKTPLSMLAVDPSMPTCIDEFVDKMHTGRENAIFPGKTSTDIGTWMDMLAIKRGRKTPYYRHTGWVLSRRM